MQLNVAWHPGVGQVLFKWKQSPLVARLFLLH